MVKIRVQSDHPAFGVSVGGSWKFIKRNNRGDVPRGSYFFMGELEHKERYEFEYDSIGN